MKRKANLGAIKLSKPKSKYKSKFEERMAKLLQLIRAPFKYEARERIVNYTIPESYHKYYPDWEVGDMILETKGLWDLDDRKKILHVLEQNPELDLRMVFENPNLPINKGSKTTYAKWCDKKGIKWGTINDVQRWILENESQVKNNARL